MLLALQGKSSQNPVANDARYADRAILPLVHLFGTSKDNDALLLLEHPGDGLR